MGRAFDERLVTQMYFPSDPLFPHDPIFNSVRDPKLRELMIARFSMDGSLTTRICFAESAVPDGVPADRRQTLLAERDGDGYRFDIRLQGPDETVFFDV